MIRCFAFVIMSTVFLSCKSGKALFSSSKSYHDEYAGKLTTVGLEKSALGRMWMNAAQSALNSPITIQLPYKERGYFPAESPKALGLKFHTKRGQQIRFTLEKKPRRDFVLFADLWKSDKQPSLIYSFDTTSTNFTYDIEKDGILLLRLQPELLQSGEYELTITAGPSLKFPVSKNGRIGSFWGDSRDAGARNHEGIDIFAPKRTPVVASADGRVISVTENKLGGKVVFLRPSGKDITLYYAHLDEQLVSSGQSVKEGDQIGLVGNTGNAATTSSHLHFGIYTGSGAIDPLPFVNPVIQQPEDVSVSIKELQQPLRLNNRVEVRPGAERIQTYPAQTILFPRSFSAKELNAELPDGTIIRVPLNATTSIKSIKKQKLNKEQALFDAADTSAPRIKLLSQGTSVNILGFFGKFAYIKGEDNTAGWIPADVFN